MNESNDDTIIKKPLLQEGDSKLYDYFSYMKDADFDDYDYDTQAVLLKEFRRLSIARQRSGYDLLNNNTLDEI